VRAVESIRSDLDIKATGILPKQFADQIVAQFYDQKEGGEPAALKILAERERWGTAWPQVWQQLSKDLPPAAYVIGAGMNPEAGRRLAEVSTIKPEELNKQLVTVGAKPKDITDAVGAELRDAVLSFAGQPGADKLAGTLLDSAALLATRYRVSGKSAGEAAEQAAREVFNERYDFFEAGESTIRVPRPYDGGDIKGALKAVSRDLTGVARVDESAWVTLPNDAGIALTWMGGVVNRPDGSPVVYGWDELLNRAATINHTPGRLPPDASRRVR
jgi:hypothetical protein